MRDLGVLIQSRACAILRGGSKIQKSFLITQEGILNLSDMSAPVSSYRQVRIWLVHGTWARHRLPSLRHLFTSKKTSKWFETDSAFCSRLDAALARAGIHSTFAPFLWSGANSVVQRDQAATALSKEIAKHFDEFPSEEQVIIAHSHGGNVAIRTLSHLEDRHRNISIVTLATPFIEVRKVDISILDVLASLFMWTSFNTWAAILLWYNISYLHNSISGPNLLVLVILLCTIGTYVADILRKIHIKRGGLPKSVILEKLSAQPLADRMRTRILCIRAPNDEAALTLAAGALGNLVYRRMSRILDGIFMLSSTPVIITILIYWPYDIWFNPIVGFLYIISSIVAFPAAVFFIVGAGCRLFFGFELLRRSLKCDVPTYSSPDTNGRTDVITVENTDRNIMRHYIYENKSCIYVIANWININIKLGSA